MSDRALPSVLLLPGNMCDARLWAGGDDALAKTIATLGLKSVAVDFETDITITAMATRALNQCEGDLVPVGFSMGGVVALEMARLAPERLAGLCLIDTTAAADTRGPLRLAQQQAVASGDLVRVIVEEMKPAYLAPCNSNDPTLLAILRDMAITLGADVFVRQSEALRNRDDLTHVLPLLTMPVLLACGQEDTMCTPTIHTEMAAQINDVSLTIVPAAGHILPLEQPYIFATLISEFLTTKLGLSHD